MDPKSDNEIQEMMEEFSQDLGKNLGKEENSPRQKASLDSVFQENPIMWSAIAIAILLSLFSLFFNDSGEYLTKDMDAIRTRLDQIEKKTVSLEKGLTDQGPISSQINDLKQSISKLSSSDKTLDSGLQRLNTNLAALTKELESVKKATQNQTGNTVQASSANTIRQHTVKRGDTIYGISQKYNVPVDTLLKLNQLKKGQEIHIGQKLKIPGTGS